MREVDLCPKVRFLSFSLLALNPALIGINAQATNDSFTILFGTMALYFGYRFFQQLRPLDFMAMSLATILASLSKGNGIVVFIAIVVMFGVAFYVSLKEGYARRPMAIYTALFVASYLCVVATFGPYWQYYRQYGSPFVTNAAPVPLPYFFQKSVVTGRRSGVTSVMDSLFTFRILDMVRNPITVNEGEDYPLHRTSVWSQLYGRTHFAHFDDWPRSWQVPRENASLWGRRFRLLVINVGRIIFVAALLPTILIFVGLIRQTWQAMAFFVRWRCSEKPKDGWLLLIAVLGYTAFIAAYSLRIRDFSVMKPIFIFPAAFGFMMLFARECERLYAFCIRKRSLQAPIDAIFASLLFLYAVDVIALITALSKPLVSPIS